MNPKEARGATSQLETNYHRIPGNLGSSMSDLFTIMKQSTPGSATLSGNNLNFANSKSAGIISKNTYNLLDQNLSFSFDADTYDTEHGLAFGFFGSTLGENTLLGGGVGRLSIYGAEPPAKDRGYALPNSIAIELDRTRPAFGGDEDNLVSDPEHIAIVLPNKVNPKQPDRLDPSKTGIVHYGYKTLASAGSGWGWRAASDVKRINIQWETPAITGNGKYRISYQYLNSTNFDWLRDDYPKMLKGSLDLTAEQVNSLFGGFANNMYFGIFSGGKSRVSIAQSTNYNINFFKTDQNGEATNQSVEELNSWVKSGTLNVGSHDFSKDFPGTNVPGYTFIKITDDTYVPGEKPWVRYISKNLHNVNFYYKPNQNTKYSVSYYFQGADGNDIKMYTYSATGTTGTEVTAKNLSEYLNSSSLSNEEKNTLLNGYNFDSSKSKPKGKIDGDGTTELKMYYKAKDGIPYTVEYRKATDNSLIGSVSSFSGEGKFLETVDLSQAKTAGSGQIVNALEKNVTGYKPKDGNPKTITLSNVSDNKAILFYEPRTDVTYTVNYYFKKFDDSLNDINGYYSDGTSTTYAKHTDVTKTYKGTADTEVNVPALGFEDYPKPLKPNNLSIQDGAFKLDTTKSNTKITIKADGTAIADVYYNANRYPFYVERYTQKPGTNGNSPEDYVLYTREDPGSRGWGTKRNLWIDGINIDGYTYNKEATSKIEEGRISISDGPLDINNPQAFTGLVLRGYYKARTDLTYTVNYLDANTKEVLKKLKNVTGQQMGTTVTENAEIIKGYSPDKSSKSIIIGTSNNEILFLYTPKDDTAYKVEYYKMGTNEPIKTINLTGTTNTNVSALDVKDSNVTSVPGLSNDELANLKTELEDWDFNATASKASGVISGDVTETLKMVYSPKSGVTYKTQYYLEDGNNLGTYKLNKTIESKGIAGETAKVYEDIFKGYEYDPSNSNGVSSGKINSGLVLKAYYKAKDTGYKITHLYESSEGTIEKDGKKYRIDTILDKTGKTGSTINVQTESTYFGYEYAKSEFSNDDHVVTGDGQNIVDVYFDAKEVGYKVKHYFEYRQDTYPETYKLPSNPAETIDNPFVDQGLKGKTGTPIEPKTINNLEHSKFNDLGKYFVGFEPNINPSSTYTDNSGNVKLGKILSGTPDNNDINIYYKALLNRPYTIKYFIKDKNDNKTYQSGADLQALDGLTTATVNLKGHVKSFPGYKFDGKGEIDLSNLTMPSEYNGYVPEKLYNGKGQPLYPNVPRDSSGVVINMYYVPDTVHYKVEYYLPESLDSSGNPVYGTIPLVVENKSGLTGDEGEYKPLLGENDDRFRGYEFSTEVASPNNKVISGMGDTVIKVYYKSKNDTPYRTEYFLEKTDDKGNSLGYNEAPDESHQLTGKTLEKITSPLKSFDGYEEDVTKNTEAGSHTTPINGDGSTVLKFYYKAKESSYKVEYYLQELDGTYKDTPSEADSFVGKTGAPVKSIPKDIEGFYNDSGNQMSLSNGQIKGDNSLTLKLYYLRKQVGYHIKYMRTQDGETSDGVAVKEVVTKEGLYGQNIDINSGDLIATVPSYKFIKVLSSNLGSLTNNDDLNEAVLLYEIDTTKDALKKAIDDGNAVKSTYAYYNGTEPMKKALEDALKKGEEIFKDQFALQKDIDKAKEDIESAIKALDGTVTNKSKLDAAINSGNSIKSHYKYYNGTEEQKKALDDALSKAELVKANPKATQAEVDAAQKDIEDAIAGLSGADTDKEALKEIIQKAKDLKIPEETTDSNAKNVLELLNKAIRTNNNPSATAFEVTKITKELTDAVNDYIRSQVIANLEKTINEALDKLNNGVLWTPKSMDALKEQIDKGKEMLSNIAQSSISEINQMIESIKEKADNLKEQANREELEKQIGIAKNLNIDPETLDKEDKDVIIALKEAEKVFNDKNSSQDEVDKAAQDLSIKLKEKEIQDKLDQDANNFKLALDSLKETLSEAKSIEKDIYKPSTVETLSEAINAGDIIVANEGLGKTIEEINATRKSILDAIDNLKLKPNKEEIINTYTISENIVSEDPTEEDPDNNLLKEAMAKAKVIIESQEATQEDVDKANDELSMVIEKKLQNIKEARKQLEEKIAEGIKYLEKTDVYTETSLSFLDQAIVLGQKTLLEDKATFTELNKAIKELEDGIERLSKKVNPSEPITPVVPAKPNPTPNTSGAVKNDTKKAPDTGDNSGLEFSLLGMLLMLIATKQVYKRKK